MSATPRMATPTPPMMRGTPGSARWPGALMAVTVNHTRAAATIAPITTSTYRKAAWENTVPRRTIVTSRHTQTSATWADPGVTLIMGGIGVAILGVALIVLVLRMLLAQAVARDVEAAHMQAELDQVI